MSNRKSGNRYEDQTKDGEFRIGLVMAGAISGGAYTAGVLDFLLEAVSAWEDAKKKQKDSEDKIVPEHRIRLDAITGTSAGGIVAAQFASALRNPAAGTRSALPDEDAKSPLYRAWVLEVDIKAMLHTHDLVELRKSKDRTPPSSLLNVSHGPYSLEAIKDRALDVSSICEKAPRWVKDPLPLMLGVTNLRGVPYGINFRGEEGKTHDITNHRDYVHFTLSAQNTFADDDYNAVDYDVSSSTLLNLKASGNVDGWAILGEAALTTSAFPFAFKPRWITRDLSVYEKRLWPTPLDKSQGQHAAGDPTKTLSTIDWRHVKPLEDADVDASFVAVDGGAMDNEPMELARRTIADITGRNERDISKASRMVVMIDPFPTPAKVPDHTKLKTDLLSTAGLILTSMQHQNRFKNDELSVFGNAKPGSRFIIAPSRTIEDGSQVKKAPADTHLASATFGAFGGLLFETWRHHDYLLGRVNCQRFLQEWFVVPQEHRLVRESWTKQMIEKYGTERRDQCGRCLLPIIPLVKDIDGVDLSHLAIEQRADSGSNMPVWPTIDRYDLEQRLFANGQRLSKRIDLVLAAYLRHSNTSTPGILHKAIGFGLRKGLVCLAYGKIRRLIKEQMNELEHKFRLIKG